MTLNSNDILYFFGAGASAPFGIPTMKKLTENFKDKIKDKEKDLYTEIVTFLQTHLGPDLDIEAIFSVIEGLKNYNIDSLGELPVYTAEKLFGENLLNNKVIPDSDILSSLERSFQNFIRISCRLDSKYQGWINTVYSHFFNEICTSLSGVSSPNSKVRYDTRWTFFTTNYDRVLEAFWRDNLQVPLFTGFPYGTFVPDEFLRSFASKLQFLKDGSGMIRLVKLHGSGSWLIRNDTREIVEKEYDKIQAVDQIGTGELYSGDIMIYPLRQKHLYIDPYIQMFYCLNKELESRSISIVVGYSFRDSIIRKIFDNSLKMSEKNRMILVHPKADEILRLFPDHQEKIISIKKYFGEADYEEVNRDVSQQLNKL